MIAGDDDDVNTCGLAGGDGGRDAVSHRILKGQQSGETEVTRRLCAGPCRVQRQPCASDDFVTGLGEGRHLIDPTLAISGRQRDKRQHDLRSALRAREDLTAFVTFDRSLSLAILGEWERCHTFAGGCTRERFVIDTDKDGRVQGVAALPT